MLFVPFSLCPRRFSEKARKRESKKARKQESEKARKRESEKARKRESEKARKRESEKARKQESKKARKQESKKARKQESKKVRKQESKSTLDTLILLDNTVFDKYKFATVTFEHDIYTGDWYNTRALSREIFLKRGYLLVFPDVQVFYNGRYVPFEDLYIHPELVDMTYVNLIKSEDSMHSDDIIRKIVSCQKTN